MRAVTLRRRRDVRKNGLVRSLTVVSLVRIRNRAAHLVPKSSVAPAVIKTRHRERRSNRDGSTSKAKRITIPRSTSVPKIKRTIASFDTI